MKQFFTLFIFLAGTIIAHAQVLSNYYYNKDIQNAPQEQSWPCGDRQFTAASDVMIYVPPDAWILELHGTEEATTLELARTRLQTRISAFQKKLNAMGIANTDITITTFRRRKIPDGNLHRSRAVCTE
jgi:uncharacterized protein YggE